LSSIKDGLNKVLIKWQACAKASTRRTSLNYSLYLVQPAEARRAKAGGTDLGPQSGALDAGRRDSFELFFTDIKKLNY